MPLYEYECQSCGNRFELIQKFSDPPAEVCPSCGGEVRKLPSSPAIQFKGTGWYITDYARKGAGSGKDQAAASGNGAPAGGESKAAEPKSGDTKPADTKPAESKPATKDS
jgi:putative FmdB family regulatory protein